MDWLKQEAVDSQSIVAFVLYFLEKQTELKDRLQNLSVYLPKLSVVIAQKLRSFTIDCVDNVTVEKVSRYEAREDFRYLNGVIAARSQTRQELVLVKAVNAFDVRENSETSKLVWELFALRWIEQHSPVLLTAKRFRKLLPTEYCHVVLDARFERPNVILFVLQKFTYDVEKLRRCAENVC